MTAAGSDDARAVEVASLRAWPPIEEERMGDWRLRCSEGFSKRANSVQALGDPGVGVEDAVERSEAWYAMRGRPCIFRITPFTHPGLERRLGKRAYTMIERTHVLHRGVEGLGPTAAAAASGRAGPETGASGAERGRGRHTERGRLELAPAELHDWLREYARLNQAPAAPAPLGRIISGIGSRLLLGVLRRGRSRRVVGCGLAVLDGPLLGLFDLVVDPEERRQGLGRALVTHLVAWGVEGGAGRVYLQVTGANTAALGLYRGLGFEPLYDYWYRIPPD